MRGEIPNRSIPSPVETSRPFAESAIRRGFGGTLASLGVHPVAFRVFPDHHPYQRGDVEDLIEWARGSGADLVLTTQKDSVKLRVETLGAVPLRALRIGLEVLEGQDLLEQALRNVWPADRKIED